MTWPAATVMPSCTMVWRTTPDTFERTVAWASGVREPDSGSVTASGRASTTAMSRADSSCTVSFLSAAPARRRRGLALPACVNA